MLLMVPDSEIRTYNPWWLDPTSIHRDSDLISLRESSFQWTPPVLHEIPLRPKDTTTLRGPRQVGKTTTVKQLIAELLKRGETRILYFAFDFSRDNRDIPAVIRRAKQIHPAGDGPWFLFLDEITSVPEWTVGVKVAWDQGDSRGDFLLCTGSSARQMGAEQLVGRRGRGHDYLQLPISFRDYCTGVRGLEVPEALGIEEAMTPVGLRRMRELYLQHDALSDALATYALCGGFPQAVSDMVKDHSVASETVRMLWDMVASDIQQAHRDKLVALKLLERVNASLGSSFVWQSAARAMDVSDVTAKAYAQLLAESFALLIVHHWDLGGGGLETRPPRKVYFIDPLLAAVASQRLRQARQPSEDALLENLVAISLYRCATESLVQAEPLATAVGYWKSRRGHEIDFVVAASAEGLKASRLPIEVKGDGKRGLAAARQSIAHSFGRGIIVSRTVFDPDPTIPTIPAAVFLATLGERTQRREAAL